MIRRGVEYLVYLSYTSITCAIAAGICIVAFFTKCIKELKYRKGEYEIDEDNIKGNMVTVICNY